MRPHITETHHRILRAVHEGHNYAHAIVQAASVPRGGINAHLERLITDGLIERLGQARGAQTRNIPRRVVGLTPEGERVLQAEEAAERCYEATKPTL